MPAPISHNVKEQVIKRWIGGDTRSKIAIDNDIGVGTITNIVNDWKQELENSEYESVRELAKQAKKEGLTLSDLSSCFRLHNFIKKLGASQDQIESFIGNVHSISGTDNLPQEKIVGIVNQLFDVSKSETIQLDQVPQYTKQKLQEKQQLGEQIKAAESVLQSKNVSIEAVNEHIHLQEELSKYGLSTKNTCKILNVINNIEEQGFNPKKIVAKLSSVESLENIHKKLKSNCTMLAKQE